MSESPFQTLNAADVLDSLTSGAVICQPNGTILYANPELGRLLHQEASTLAGKPLADLLQLPPKSDCALCLGVKG
jgi:PAS domain-containing protein